MTAALLNKKQLSVRESCRIIINRNYRFTVLRFNIGQKLLFYFSGNIAGTFNYVL